MSATAFIDMKDILYHIASHITADIEVQPTLESCFPASPSNLRSNAARGTLARLARVHTNFTQPALAALWGCLPSDEPLRHLLAIARIERILAREQENASLEGALATHRSTWTRFQGYASLVRAITIDPSVRTSESPPKLLQGTFWSRISPTLGGTPILPRLKAATLFSIRNFSLFDFDMGILCLLNPSIRELHVLFLGVGPREQSNFRRVLSSCLQLGHNLEELSVIVPVPVLDIELLPHSHPRLRRLKFDEDGARPKHLALLAALPDLEHLSITLNPLSSLNLPITFAELRSLEVSSHSFVGIGSFIAHLDAPQLQSLSISESEVHPDSYHSYPQELSDHLRTVVRKYLFLSAFRWTSRDLPPSGLEDVPRVGMTLAALLEPLLSLRAMRSFSASFTTPLITHSSADFLKIAEAWPCIETFDLSMADNGADQYADLETLASFAHRCPRLRELRIPTLKLDPNISTPVVPVGPAMRHFLRGLKVDNVILPTEQFEEATRQREVLSGLIKQVFPSAEIRFPPIRAPRRSRNITT